MDVFHKGGITRLFEIFQYILPPLFYEIMKNYNHEQTKIFQILPRESPFRAAEGQHRRGTEVRPLLELQQAKISEIMGNGVSRIITSIRRWNGDDCEQRDKEVEQMLIHEQEVNE